MKKYEQEQVSEVLTFLSQEIYGDNYKRGWHTNLETGVDHPNTPEQILVKLMLVVTEVAEAAEGVRKDLMDDHLPHRKMCEVELADAIIRILDLAGRLGYDIGGAVVEKLEYNANRADHKIENRKKEGGKVV